MLFRSRQLPLIRWLLVSTRTLADSWMGGELPTSYLSAALSAALRCRSEFLCHQMSKIVRPGLSVLEEGSPSFEPQFLGTDLPEPKKTLVRQVEARQTDG